MLELNPPSSISCKLGAHQSERAFSWRFFWVSGFFLCRKREWLYFPLKVSTTSQCIYDGFLKRESKRWCSVKNQSGLTNCSSMPLTYKSPYLLLHFVLLTLTFPLFPLLSLLSSFILNPHHLCFPIMNSIFLNSQSGFFFF